jgi:hypothetical protein
MKAVAEIDAGVCNFHTTVRAVSEDEQNVTFRVVSECEKIRTLGEALKAQGPFDAYQEINPAGESVVMQTVREVLKGCCAGCAVPVGVFKAMQVSARLALPADISIRLSKDEG